MRGVIFHVPLWIIKLPMKTRVFLSFLLVTLLAGCYEIEQPVIDSGDKIGFVGVFFCKNLISGKKEKITLREESSGIWPFSSYSYYGEEGQTRVFKKIENKFYYGHEYDKKRGVYLPLFLEKNDGDYFDLSVVSLVTQEAAVNQLAKKYNIKIISSKMTGFVKIAGDRKSISEFLSSHNKSMMQKIMICGRG